MTGFSTQSQNSEYCASIGAVVRELRQARKLSRTGLSRESEIPLSRLASVERGDSYPDDATLERIAAALGITNEEIYTRACDMFQQRVQLQTLLEDLRIPQENWQEFFALDPSARSLFIETLQVRLPSRDERRAQLRDIENVIARDGLERSIPMILSAVTAFGLTPADHLRASVEFEEMPGSRRIVTDRLPMSPVSLPIDQLFLFRANYGMEPPNPMLLKWWAETRRSALDVTLQDYESRTIIPAQRLEHYIRTGERAPNLVVPAELVQEHLVAIIELLRTRSRFQLGLAQDPFPLTYRIKGTHHVLVTARAYQFGEHHKHARTTLRFSRPSSVRRFSEHFDELWDRLEAERKDQERIANWLEEQLPDIDKRGRR